MCKCVCVHVRWGGWGKILIDLCTLRMAMALAIFLSLFRPFFIVCFETTICLRALASVCIIMAGTPSLYDVINYDVIITSLSLQYDVINYDVITTSLSLLYDVINYDVIITSLSLLESSSSLPCSSSPVKKNFRPLTRI